MNSIKIQMLLPTKPHNFHKEIRRVYSRGHLPVHRSKADESSVNPQAFYRDENKVLLNIKLIGVKR